jgi:hypothetical protein
MGGRGELVNYRRIKATTQAQRNRLKREINDIIDQAADLATSISVIALVEEPLGLRKRKTKRRATRKKKRRA